MATPGMDSAIITGATGLLGRALSSRLAANGIPTVCVGRRPLSVDEITTAFCAPTITYLQIQPHGFKMLPTAVLQSGWCPGSSCVWYHCAWGGASTLTDGAFETQFANATDAADAVLAAHEIGCRTFVNVGSMEETLAEQHIREKPAQPYSSSQPHYAISKLAARDMCRIVAYLNKIDYIHARLSAPIHHKLLKGGYIARTLKSILERRPYAPPRNLQLYDIVVDSDVAHALHLIGLHGRNTADYFIGTGSPRPLLDYFVAAQEIVAGGTPATPTLAGDREAGPFTIEVLAADTGYRPVFSFEQFIRSFVNSCGKQS